MTADDIIIKYESTSGLNLGKDYNYENLKKCLVEFAKLKVTKALEKANENATMEVIYPDDYADSNEKGLTYVNAHDVERGGEYGCITIEEESILNAYPLDLIK
jgi:ASC-1-like (ASCH) protein